MAAAEARDDGTEEKPKKKGMLMVIIGVLLIAIAGGGFVAYKKFLAPHPAISAEEQGKKEPVEKEGEIFALEPFVVNLSDPKGKRYLKVTITLELEAAPNVKEKVEKAIPKMRDMVIMMLTSLTFEEVMTPEGKIRVRDDLLERFNLILRPERVKDLYFTDFVVQ